MTIDLADLRIQSAQPFSSHESAVDDRLHEAFGTLKLLAAAYDLAGMTKNGNEDALLGISPFIVARTLDGISTLVALAIHHGEAQAAETEAGSA